MTSIHGPLHVLASNPRYFTDGSGRAVYLTGSHTWSNFKDMGPADPPAPFPYTAYLDELVKHHHNFIRLWTWELTKYQYSDEKTSYAAPFPWVRTGPELALDGKPKFDLHRFDPAYFKRLRSRVEEAGKRGIYVSIMLFEGHGVQESLPPWRWDGHQFNAHNNVNGINGDTNRDGQGIEIDTLENPEVTALQEAYVRRVVDSVNDLDNVLYEISNEAGPYSTDWQYHMIRFVKTIEARKRKQHQVGMTFQYSGGSNETLFKSPADWISPNSEGGYQDNPPASAGRKVILSDTDHLWGEGGDEHWVWKSFLRGLNPIYMDRMVSLTAHADADLPGAEESRQAMGQTRRIAERMDLAAMTPHNALASTEYCLANPGREYLVYLPEGGEATVDLSAAKGPLAAEWIHPVTGQTIETSAVQGGEKHPFKPPFTGDAVLYLHPSGRR